jgi:cyclic-di-GMP-binding biofilm dispersal mediator protein
MFSFANRKVFVVGGSRGIGAALVRKFAEAAANVTFTYASSADQAAALAAATGARARRADSADRAALAGAIAEEGAIDILLANAGVLVMGDPLSIDPAAIDRMIDINIRGSYFAAVEAARNMPDNGRILIIGADGADRIHVAGASAYVMTKSAMQAMVRGLARDFGPRGITVNAIQPGPVDTGMNPADGPLAEMIMSSMAIKRFIRPDEVADYALFLASPAAGMITGALQTIDGGHSA